MISVDANVLLRLFVDDNADQHRRARAFFADRNPSDPAYVDLLVVAEFTWLLDRRYGYSLERVVSSLRYLLSSSDFAVEDSALLASALDAASARAGIVDCLIALKSQQAGARATVTFDYDAAKKVPGMEALK